MNEPDQESPVDAPGIEELRRHIDEIDREIVELLARRVDVAIAIARLKTAEGIDLRSPDREEDLLAVVRTEAERLGLDVGLVSGWFVSILEYSRMRQADTRDDC